MAQTPSFCIPHAMFAVPDVPGFVVREQEPTCVHLYIDGSFFKDAVIVQLWNEQFRRCGVWETSLWMERITNRCRESRSSQLAGSAPTLMMRHFALASSTTYCWSRHDQPIQPYADATFGTWTRAGAAMKAGHSQNTGVLDE